ncbi:MAG TPA: AAA family ATPase [Leptospiraceae bacterium]|nr:AAA family ATPase [Leptospiraceae bacterium]HMX31047.1 AAA family ATPase [Leptospiraceae bacterium]HMY31863.1 AAA family ATPase [Leptospiraceae bacterium]HNA06322.1 AAA family ATPase [Leptospiraceae bacterium]HNB97377.1 AAA family ATPase [Leptospiraceae bacterium]
MISLDRTDTIDEIYTSDKTTIFRSTQNNTSIIIKTLHKEYPEPEELSEFKNEYEILKKLNGKGLVRALGFEKFNSNLAILFEDIGGTDLSTLLYQEAFSLQDCLDIMIKATKALAHVHNANIVHRDIKTQNIVLNRKTGELQIIDFGSASFLLKQNSFIPMNSSLEGTLAYISPEQTGRMNRTVDYRTDYYSLGVTFYQLLTKELPFVYSDPMELVHAHLAKVPVSPYTKCRIPKIISDITMKLLQKNPEDRYQSAMGIVYDLEWSLKNIVEAYTIMPPQDRDSIIDRDDFLIAQNDFTTRFQIPEKLYGRSKEIIQILKSFKNVTEGDVELVLISGRSGSGKSILINEINKPIVEYKGYFASGKYDQYKRNIPYYGITLAFKNLLKQILTENQESIQYWKENLQDAVGANGKVIIDVIPELETLLGEQPPVVELGISESQNRFNLVFQNFIKAFCMYKHPIALFIDDLQWADNPSIALIQSILTNPEVKFLLLILSYRDNEVLQTHPFFVMLEHLKEINISYKSIFLDSFSVKDVTHIVQDTLHCEKIYARQLATILHTKTKGNPYFVMEMFRSFYERDLIEYVGGKWVWNIIKIEEAKVSDNVIDLLVEKVKDLTLSQVETLKLAACIGDSFSSEILYMVSKKTRDVLTEELTKISNDGFLIISKNTIKFVHDKVREATYTLIGDAEKTKNHYLIGKAFIQLIKPDQIEDFIFVIVNQLNQSLGLLETDEERKDVIRLNTIAGNKSLAASAFDSALVFFNIAVSLLPEDAWQVDYKETIQLYSLKARAESLSANYLMAESTFEAIATNAKGILDKINAYELKSSLYSSQLRLRDSIILAANALKLLGIKLPMKPTELSVIPELIKAKILIGHRSVSDFYNLLIMENESDLARMRLLSICIPPSYLSLPLLFPVLVMKMVSLSLSKGISMLSPFAFSIYGMILGSALGDYKTGSEWGKLAIDLIDKYDFKSVKAKTYMVYGCSIHHWTHHAKTNEEFILKAIQAGIENGDSEYASYALIHLEFQAFAMRKPLNEVIDLFNKMRPTFLKIRQEHAYDTASIIEQTSVNFVNLNSNYKKLSGEIFNEEKSVPLWTAANNSSLLNCYYTVKCLIGYFFEDCEIVESYCKLAKKHEKSNLGTMFLPEFTLFETLNLGKLYLNTESFYLRMQYLRRMLQNKKKMGTWAKNCEDNFGHKFHIISGLIYFIKGKLNHAIVEYRKAIDLAKKSDYLLEEAIANELCGSVWKELNADDYEKLHLTEAYYAYKKWNFLVKVKELEERYPFLKRRYAEPSSNVLVTNSKTVTGGNFLDLNTVVKASQTISGEIQLGKLLGKMMKILFENAGAQRGYFILKDKDQLRIEAAGDSETDSIVVLQNIPITGDEISIGIVNYVARTKTIVLLNDAPKSGIFINDTYVQEKNPKSILCYPIINQGILVGLVYLENNLITDAFTPERVEILKVLSSQIAVSVENSLLYARLEEKVEERTRDLNQALVEVNALKEQQDGDYFLNTLLIEPLAKNNAVSENIEIDFFIHQKKQFIFRKEKYELGGDINISENIIIQDKKYIIFLNGDAMGKSIQGAGGVLVLGTVFKSIVERTMSTNYGKTVYPEKWLKDAFIEMHKTFVSFDGSMLMSIVFGLIDDRTGVMYFLNAEHPNIVLYRDRQASFIDNGNQYTKLGTQGQTGSISVQVFSLLPQDMVIFGSDGRDDIIIGKEEETGYDILNLDSELFLRHVENAEGDLKKIYENILSTGKPIDDISLGKIYFKNYDNSKSKVKLETAISQLTYYKEQNDQNKLVELYLELISDYPHLTNYILEIAILYKEMNQIENALLFAERARIRQPKNLNNLLLLVQIYLGKGNMEKAKILLNTCKELNAEDPRVLELSSQL